MIPSKAIRFEKGCHGFKLSPMFKNRIYFYPKKGEYNLTMREIEPGKWSIESVVEKEKETIVYLNTLQ